MVVAVSSAEAGRGWGAMLRLAAMRLATAGGLVAAAWLVGAATAHAAESPTHPGDARNPSGVANPGQHPADVPTWAGVSVPVVPDVPGPVADGLPELGVLPAATTVPTGSGSWRPDSVPEDVPGHGSAEAWLVAEPTPAEPGHAESGVPCHHGSHGWHLHLPGSAAHLWSGIPSWVIARVPMQSLGLPIALPETNTTSTTAAPAAAAQPEPGAQTEPQVLSASQSGNDTAQPVGDGQQQAGLPLLKLLTVVPPLLGGGSEPQDRPVLPVPVDVGQGAGPQTPNRPVAPEEPATGVPSQEPPHDGVLPTDPQLPGLEESDTPGEVEVSRPTSSGRHTTGVKRVKKAAAVPGAGVEKDLDRTSPARPLPEPKPHPAPVSSSTSSLTQGEGGGLRVLVATPTYQPLMDRPSAIHAEWLDVARLTGVSTQRPVTSPD